MLIFQTNILILLFPVRKVYVVFNSQSIRCCCWLWSALSFFVSWYVRVSSAIMSSTSQQFYVHHISSGFERSASSWWYVRGPMQCVRLCSGATFVPCKIRHINTIHVLCQLLMRSFSRNCSVMYHAELLDAIVHMGRIDHRITRRHDTESSSQSLLLSS